MIKLIAAFSNPNDVSRDESRSRYRNSHGRLAASVPEVNRHLPKYVQNVVIDDLPLFKNVGPNIVGISEIWSYSVEGMSDGFAEPRYSEFRRDEMTFADLGDLILICSSPAFIYGVGQDTPHKLFRFYNKARGVAESSFRKVWEVDYASAIAFDPRIRAVSRSYVQDRPIRNLKHSFPVVREFDAADEFWIDDLNVLPELLAAEQALAERIGVSKVFSLETKIEVVTRANLLWDFGENPSAALIRFTK